MSGGFFRGTTADQDTRFSNKHAKLMKSQKFAPELEHLIDMTKVSIDVMRPWIASRVTELLGFEDEVLINFIYGLLEGKVVNGKEIQISLTGFMEKNTVKFMKELWKLLISAQNNVSGVPQKFLDDKEAEARKKKEEADRLASEIQKKKDKDRIDQKELLKKMEGGADKKASNVALEPNSKHISPRDLPEAERGTERNGLNARNRVSRSPTSENSSLSPRERNRSKSVSKSPKGRGRSVYSERGGYRSPPRRPTTTFQRHSSDGSLSPYSGRKSISNSPQRSPSPYQRRLRSPYRRRSPSLGRRRSPPPVRHRRAPSPFRRRRSPSPVRHRRSPSPVRRRRSPSPVRCRRSPSPVRRRRSPSPVRRRRSRSPVRHRSPSPVRRSYRRSPLPPRNKFASPMQRRSPVRGGRRSPTPPQRSLSPYKRSSLSPGQRGSHSSVRRTAKPQRSPSGSSEERTRPLEKFSPVLKESKNENDSRKRAPDFSPSPVKSHIQSESPLGVRGASEVKRSCSPYESPVRRPRKEMTRDVISSPPRKPLEQKLRRGSPKLNKEDREGHRPRSVDRRSNSTSVITKAVISSAKVHSKEEYSPGRVASGHISTESRSHVDKMEFRNKEQEIKSGKSSGRGAPDQPKPSTMYKDSVPGGMKQESYPDEGRKSDDKNRSHSRSSKDSDWHRKPGCLPSSLDKVDHSNRSGTLDSGSEESGKHTGGEKEKRKMKRSERQEVTSDDSSDSEREERKGTRRRRKEEKRLRKEKKRQRREERHRRKEQRRAEKLKGKNYSDASASDGEHVGRRELHSCDNEETEDQKKLEIELRNKALESLKAKKGTSQ